jgi:opacity protein-like surface antigen
MGEVNLKKEYPKLKRFIFVLVAAVFSATVADALELRPYISEKVSYSDVTLKDSSIRGGSWKLSGTEESDGVFGNRLAVGIQCPLKKIAGTVRAEFEWGVNGKAETYSQSVTGGGPGAETKTELKSSTFLFNAYYNLCTGTAFSPYISAGIGFCRMDSELYSAGTAGDGAFSDQKFIGYEFVWQTGLGLDYAINENISFGVGYRYQHVSETTSPVSGSTFSNFRLTKATPVAHEIDFGVRYTF